MTREIYEAIIDALVEKINRLETKIIMLDYENKNLKKEKELEEK